MSFDIDFHRTPDSDSRSEDERTIGMRIEVEYHADLSEMASMNRGGETLFYRAVHLPRTDTNGNIIDPVIPKPQKFRAPHSLDPFRIREAFTAVKTESDALRFLSQGGPFWLPGASVTWREFQEWQRLVYLVRQEDFPEQAVRDEQAGQAMRVVMGWPSKFFTAPEFPESELQKQSLTLAKEMIPGLEQEMAEADMFCQQELRKLGEWFREPPSEAFSILWTGGQKTRARVEEDLKARNPRLMFSAVFAIKDYDFLPFLQIKATNVLEAVAATIYADRCHGIQYGRCERCGRLFERKSGHRQKYCRHVRADGTVLESCKNAAVQKKWRKREKDEKARLLAGASRKEKKRH